MQLEWAAEESCPIFCIIVEITLWGTITSELSGVLCSLFSDSIKTIWEPHCVTLIKKVTAYCPEINNKQNQNC